MNSNIVWLIVGILMAVGGFLLHICMMVLLKQAKRETSSPHHQNNKE